MASDKELNVGAIRTMPLEMKKDAIADFFISHYKNFRSDLSPVQSLEGISEFEQNTSPGGDMMRVSKARPDLSHLPSQTMIASLVQYICILVEPSPRAQAELFKTIANNLVMLQLVSPLPYIDEFSSVRNHYSSAFHKLIVRSRLSLNRYSPVAPKGTVKDNISIHYQPEVTATTSRYKSEFDELEKLGSGGFGHVYRVRNKLDSNEYAVKKIRSMRNEAECRRILTEVKIFSGLDHPHVVRYYCAWMEYQVQAAGSVLTSGDSSASNSCSQPRHLLGALPPARRALDETSDTSSDGGIVFSEALDECHPPHLPPVEEKTSVTTVVVTTATPATTVTTATNSTTVTTATNSKTVTTDTAATVSTPTTTGLDEASSGSVQSSAGMTYTRQNTVRGAAASEHSLSASCDSDTTSRETEDSSQEYCLMLFIQMQLCSRTLRHWLDDRNDRVLRESPSDIFELVDHSECKSILSQVLEGLAYVHEKGIVHRDITPSNIFFSGDRLLIGDFGLACVDAEDGSSWPPKFDSPFKHAKSKPSGTYFYAAPEQRSKNVCTKKSDIYSLGIIFFELLCPFGTNMERVTQLARVRQGVPEAFQRAWPVESQLLKTMLAEKQSDRPTAKQILETLNASKETLVGKINSLQCTIRKLRLENKKKDDKIFELLIQTLQDGERLSRLESQLKDLGVEPAA